MNNLCDTAERVGILAIEVYFPNQVCRLSSLFLVKQFS